MRPLLGSLIVALSLACTGAEPTLGEAFTKVPRGACDGLDTYAQAVEAYVTAYEELDPAGSSTSTELAARRADIVTRARAVGERDWFTAPACASRYAEINERMVSAQQRAQVRRDQLQVTSAEAKACLTTCPNGESDAAKACVASCRSR